ncbi:MAG: tyrosinase family protein [Sphingomonadaceae bacterium]
MSARVRRSVWSLGEGDETLLWYRRAVAELIRRPIEDPTSWRYLAGVHGYPDGRIPGWARDWWDQCQHQSWFFLPWHRGYLAHFEAIVADAVAGLAGPADWALPYWDYSEPLSANPAARRMPAEFLDRQVNGSPNALWAPRARSTNGDFGLEDWMVSLDALRFANFTDAAVNRISGFGGPVTGFHAGGGDNGALESLPHNLLHVQIGGRNGYMSFPDTAALDPIFWIHHCNIDRLWEVWRNQGPRFRVPAAPQWLSGVVFQLRQADGGVYRFTSEDMLDTTDILHGYRYDGVPVAGRPPAEEFAMAEEMMADSRRLELAGASEGPVRLEGDVTRAQVTLAPRMDSFSFTESALPTPEHVYLRLENITGSGAPGDFKVYIDMPGDAEEPRMIGVMTTFGLERASRPDSGHGGMSEVFEITEHAERLGITEGTVDRLQVSFVREAPPPSEEETR